MPMTYDGLPYHEWINKLKGRPMPAKRKRTPRTHDDAIQWLRTRARDFVKLAQGFPVSSNERDHFMLKAAACNTAAGLLANVTGKVERKSSR